jgi:hypothetical protein
MRKHIIRAAVAVSAAAALTSLGATTVSATGNGPQAAVTAPSMGASQAAAPGAQLWVKRYNGTGNGNDRAMAVATSPGGRKVFVTGSSRGTTTYDCLTVGYDTATGARLWVSRYRGPAVVDAKPVAVRVSPDGATVFVTGYGFGDSTGEDYVTVAYRASNGQQLWVQTYNGLGNGMDQATDLSVARDGSKVFVTGFSWGGTATNYDYATIAYDSASGAQLWADRFIGVGGQGSDSAEAVASPAGNRVFVTGSSQESGGKADYATIAYSATTGAVLWLDIYHGPGNRQDYADAVVANPAGSKVFVSGQSDSDYGTIAYRAATGARLWVKHYNGPGNGDDFPTAATMNPGGGMLFVTGSSQGKAYDYATIAYRAATGARAWVSRYNGPGKGTDTAWAVASPGNGDVYITGASKGTRTVDYATIAYRAATGARAWVRRYNGPGNGHDEAWGMAMRPSPVTLFVTGYSMGTHTEDYATIAYRG